MAMRKRKTLSLDLRERILASYDAGEGTREDMAKRFRVSLGMVKKLLQLRRQHGEIGHRHQRAGRKPVIRPEHQPKIRALLAEKVDLTLRELRAALELPCSIQALHVVLRRMNLTYKKRHSAPASRIVRTSPGRGARGGGARVGSIRRG